MSQYQENIHIAINGPVSAGKSTLLNGLFAITYSQMKKKRTTMLPNIYQTTHNTEDVDTFETIQKKNNDSNEEIFKLRESGQYNHTHFKEIIHKVKPIENFIDLPDKNATYSLLDMPGINDQDAQIYYDYIKNNSHKIDIYILVFDINSPLNRTDEVKILQEITNHIKTNKHGYVHILINKCDDITFDTNDKFSFDDEENQESYDECIKTINKFMKDIMDRVTISPMRSSLLYTYRTAIYNIDSLDEKQIENIIKEEEGKNGLNGLTTCELKKKYLKGLIQDKKKKLPEGWMKSTGYDLFKKNMSKILNNYQQIILHHIEQDVDNILINVQNTNMNFDKVIDSLGEINLRFRNLTTNKYKVNELIFASQFKLKLDEITQQMNNYLVSGLNSYTANTIENADSFIGKITKFFDKVKNLFKSNPLASSAEKLKLKRIELLNNKLAESFNDDIFTELYTNKTLDLNKYVQSVANTLDNGKLKFDKLLEKVIKITSNDSHFVNVIINKFTGSYKDGTKFEDFLSNLELIANATNNNIETILQVIQCQFRYISQQHYKIYSYWIVLNSTKIEANSNEIKYVFFKIDDFRINAPNNPQITVDYDVFNGYMKDINALYSMLDKLIGNKLQKTVHTAPLITKKSEQVLIKPETDDEFLDAQEEKKESIDSPEEKSDSYNDSDDSDTVYKKAMKNTKVRTNRRVNKGAKITTLTK